MIDRTKESWSRPSLDLYYQQGLKNKQLLVFNVVGTYNKENHAVCIKKVCRMSC